MATKTTTMAECLEKLSETNETTVSLSISPVDRSDSGKVVCETMGTIEVQVEGSRRKTWMIPIQVNGVTLYAEPFRLHALGAGNRKLKHETPKRIAAKQQIESWGFSPRVAEAFLIAAEKQEDDDKLIEAVETAMLAVKAEVK